MKTEYRTARAFLKKLIAVTLGTIVLSSLMLLCGVTGSCAAEPGEIPGEELQQVGATDDAVSQRYLVFYADGYVVNMIEFKGTDAEYELPPVPEKVGYTASWSDFAVDSNAGNVKVNAIYIANTADKLEINSSDLSGHYSDIFNIRATVTPDSACKRNIKWVSSNPEIVNVAAYDERDTSKATIRCIGDGEATITAIALDSDGNETEIADSITVHSSYPVSERAADKLSAGISSVLRVFLAFLPFF